MARTKAGELVARRYIDTLAFWAQNKVATQATKQLEVAKAELAALEEGEKTVVLPQLDSQDL